jgi:hypothetical protein
MARFISSIDTVLKDQIGGMNYRHQSSEPEAVSWRLTPPRVKSCSAWHPPFGEELSYLTQFGRITSMFSDQTTSAQAAYSAVMAAARHSMINRSSADLPGGFSLKTVKGRPYWYYQRKGPEGKLGQLYVGPDDKATRALVESSKSGTVAAARQQIRQLANAASALGCYTVVPKHFRVLQRLAEHGVFAAGAIVVGTHAFLAYQNVLGVHWEAAGATVDLDFAHPANNVSLALAPDAHVDAHSAIESLKMGFAPVNEGTRYIKPDEPEFDLDWLTSRTRTGDAPVECPALNVRLQPLRFMELSLEAPIPAAMIGNTGAIIVNLPDPVTYAVHKLLVSSERTGDHASKAKKDVAQAATLIGYFVERDQEDIRQRVEATLARGPAWRKALNQGLKRLSSDFPAIGARLHELLEERGDATGDALRSPRYAVDPGGASR